MPDYQNLLDAVANILGGTADPVVPHFYSAFKAGDATGIRDASGQPALRGCYSVGPSTIQDSPMALVLPSAFEAHGPAGAHTFVQGIEENVDHLHVNIYVAKVDDRTHMAIANTYRDIVPAAFRANIQLKATPAVIAANITGGHFVAMEWGAVRYFGWEFLLTVYREPTVTYSP